MLINLENGQVWNVKAKRKMNINWSLTIIQKKEMKSRMKTTSFFSSVDMDYAPRIKSESSCRLDLTQEKNQLNGTQREIEVFFFRSVSSEIFPSASTPKVFSLLLLLQMFRQPSLIVRCLINRFFILFILWITFALYGSMIVAISSTRKTFDLHFQLFAMVFVQFSVHFFSLKCAWFVHSNEFEYYVVVVIFFFNSNFKILTTRTNGENSQDWH